MKQPKDYSRDELYCLIQGLRKALKKTMGSGGINDYCACCGWPDSMHLEGCAVQAAMRSTEAFNTECKMVLYITPSTNVTRSKVIDVKLVRKYAASGDTFVPVIRNRCEGAYIPLVYISGHDDELVLNDVPHRILSIMTTSLPSTR